jgi:hypothetical protein
MSGLLGFVGVGVVQANCFINLIGQAICWIKQFAGSSNLLDPAICLIQQFA